METSIVSSVSLEAGLVALRQGQYQEAIALLEAFCHNCAASAQTRSRDYLQAQMHLIETYEQIGQTEQATTICYQLVNCMNAQVQIWAQHHLQRHYSVAPATPSTRSYPGIRLLNQLAQHFQAAIRQTRRAS